MQNLYAIYAPEGPISGAKFATIAHNAGYAVRFVSFGVYVDPDEYRGSNEALKKAKLLCGWQEPGTDMTRTFDVAAEAGNRDELGRLLKKGDVPWFELYPNEFVYEDEADKPKVKAKIDGSVPSDQLHLVKSAKSRYIFFNQGRRKTSHVFMTALLPVIAEAVDGVVANYVHPGR